MHTAIVLLVLGLVGCFASEPVEIPDHMLSEEELQLKRETAPSFDEIRRKLEETGVLRHPHVVGLWPHGEEPNNDFHNVSATPRPTNSTKPTTHPMNGPLCQEEPAPFIRIQYGFNAATLLIHDFSCTGTCAHCGIFRGTCRKTTTTMFYDFVFFGVQNNQLRWFWVWKSLRIPACCKCYSIRP